MGNQEPQPLARRLVGETFALIAKQCDPCAAFGCSVQIDADVVDPAPRLDQLFIKSRLLKVGVRHDRRRAEDLTDVEHKIGAGHGVERPVFLDIELTILRVGAELVGYAQGALRVREESWVNSPPADAPTKAPILGRMAFHESALRAASGNAADQLEQNRVRIHDHASAGVRSTRNMRPPKPCVEIELVDTWSASN